jgi:hypothetical protein
MNKLKRHHVAKKIHREMREMKERKDKLPQSQGSHDAPEQNYDAPQSSQYGELSLQFGEPSLHDVTSLSHDAPPSSSQYGGLSGFFPHNEGIYAESAESAESVGYSTSEPKGYYSPTYIKDGEPQHVTPRDRQRLIERRDFFQRNIDAHGYTVILSEQEIQQTRHQIDQINTFLGELKPYHF